MSIPTGTVVLIENRAERYTGSSVPTIHRIPADEVRFVDVVAAPSGQIVQYQLTTGPVREIHVLDAATAVITASLIASGGNRTFARDDRGSWKEQR